MQTGQNRRREKLYVYGRVATSEPHGEGRIMHFREEPVTPVYRHWMCEQMGAPRRAADKSSGRC
jgi:hypothetical protein